LGQSRPKIRKKPHRFRQPNENSHQIANEVAVRLMIASIRLMGQSKSMRSIIDATQPEQRRGLA